MSISLKRKKIFQKEKRHSSVFRKAFQASRKKIFHVVYTLIYSNNPLSEYGEGLDIEVIEWNIKLKITIS